MPREVRKERAPVGARPTVNIRGIVTVHVERPRRPRPFGAVAGQERVESLFPRSGMDLRGVRDHPIEVEQAGADALWEP